MTKSWYSDLPQFYQRQIKAAGLDEAGLSRRRLLKGMAADRRRRDRRSFASRPSQAASQMTYMCWEGYNDPRIIDPFKKANDVDIAFDLIVDSPGGFAKLQAGASREVDIVSSDMPWITRMGPAGLALELNPADYADVYATFYDQFKPPFEPLAHMTARRSASPRAGAGSARASTPTSPSPKSGRPTIRSSMTPTRARSA